MGKQKFKLALKAYTFKQLAEEWGCDKSDISRLVWQSKTLRAAIKAEELTSKFIFNNVKFNKLEKSTGSKIKWALYDKKTEKPFEGEFIYIIPSAYVDHGDNDFDSEPNVIDDPIKISPEKNLPVKDEFYGEYNIEDEIFCNFDGNPFMLSSFIDDWSDENSSIKPFSKLGMANIKLHKSKKYYITEVEKARFEQESANTTVSHLRDNIKLDNMKACVGALATLLSSKVSKFKVGGRPNAKEIGEAVIEMAEKEGLSIDGLKTIHATISDGLKELKKRRT